MFFIHQFKKLFFLNLIFVTPQVFSSTYQTSSTAWRWEAPYIGGFLGGAFGNYKTHTDVGALSSTSYFASEDNINSVNQSGTKSLYAQSFMLGIKAGDDWAWENLVIGLVFDYSNFKNKSNLNVTQTYPDGSGNYSLSLALKTDWLFTFRGRLGWVFFNNTLPALLYATGGMAITNLNISNTFSDDTLLLGTGSSSLSGNKIGWTVGGGIELAAIKSVSVYAEYLYVNIPTLTTNGRISNSVGGFGIPENSFSSPFLSKANLSSNLVRVGVNYRFNM